MYYNHQCSCAQDECSFVSLRDVERAMIVFEYFYDKIDNFRKAAQKRGVHDIDEVKYIM